MYNPLNPNAKGHKKELARLSNGDVSYGIENSLQLCIFLLWRKKCSFPNPLSSLVGTWHMAQDYLSLCFCDDLHRKSSYNTECFATLTWITWHNDILKYLVSQILWNDDWIHHFLKSQMKFVSPRTYCYVSEKLIEKST